MAETKPKKLTLFFSTVYEISFYLDYWDIFLGHADTTALHYPTLQYTPVHYTTVV